MSIHAIIIFVFIILMIVGLCLLANWIIEKFFPEPMKMWSKIIVGLIALIAVLYQIPGVNGFIRQ